MTLANRITILRIILIPVFIITFIQGYHPWPAIIFTFTILTDALDGFIARWKKQITPLGSFLDPMGDKLLMFSSYLVAAYMNIVPTWIFIIILSRDLIIVLGWYTLNVLTGSTEISPRWLSKITTIFQMGTMWFILLRFPLSFNNFFLLVTVVLTILSGLEYIYIGSKKLNHHA